MATRTLMLRQGDVRDVGVVEALMSAAFDPRYGEAWTRSQCMGVLAMPGVELLVAQEDDTPAGFALWRTVLDEAELLLIGVAPLLRGRGIGDALLRAVLSACTGAGVDTIHLEVRADNPAIRLYRASGFAKVGERRGYYRGADGARDAHTYSRRLVASR